VEPVENGCSNPKCTGIRGKRGEQVVNGLDLHQDILAHGPRKGERQREEGGETSAVNGEEGEIEPR